MTADIRALQNDPNCGLRGRLDPKRTSLPTAQESLTRALADLQKMARDRLTVPENTRRRRRPKPRH
ncbi:MAG: hypothetical protein M3O84_03545 [Actinomycetota bacterium]|jgi:hypothetical protein|nr:hypothetical protein [Actinomycetota bacterium]